MKNCHTHKSESSGDNRSQRAPTTTKRVPSKKVESTGIAVVSIESTTDSQYDDPHYENPLDLLFSDSNI